MCNSKKLHNFIDKNYTKEKKFQARQLAQLRYKDYSEDQIIEEIRKKL